MDVGECVEDTSKTVQRSIGAAGRSSVSVAVLTALAASLVPLASKADVVVEPVTGSLSPELRLQIEASLENVVPGAAAAYGVDGRLTVAAEENGDGGVSLAVELSRDAGVPVRLTRTAVRAEAAAELRALVREVLRAAAAPAGSGAAARPSFGGAEEGTAPGAAGAAELRAPYDPQKAAGLTLSVTLGGMLVGGALFAGAFAVDDSSGTPAMAIAGSAIFGLGLIVGPSLGHFYVHNTGQAVLGIVLRSVFSAAAPAFFVGAAFQGFMTDGDDAEEARAERNAQGLLAGGILVSIAGVASAVIDLATTPLAVQHANERETAQKVSGVSFAPIVAPGRNGAATAGLAFSMRF